MTCLSAQHEQYAEVSSARQSHERPPSSALRPSWRMVSAVARTGAKTGATGADTITV